MRASDAYLAANSTEQAANSTEHASEGQASFVQKLVENVTAAQAELSQAGTRQDSSHVATAAAAVGQGQAGSSIELPTAVFIFMSVCVLCFVAAAILFACFRRSKNETSSRNLPVPGKRSPETDKPSPGASSPGLGAADLWDVSSDDGSVAGDMAGLPPRRPTFPETTKASQRRSPEAQTAALAAAAAVAEFSAARPKSKSDSASSRRFQDDTHSIDSEQPGRLRKLKEKLLRRPAKSDVGANLSPASRSRGATDSGTPASRSGGATGSGTPASRSRGATGSGPGLR